MVAIDHAAELARYLEGKPVAIDAVLQSLPPKIDPDLAVAAALRLIDHPEWFLTATPKLPVAVIRNLLAAQVSGPLHLFLRLAVPDGKAPEMKSAWTRANQALRTLYVTEHPLESPERRIELEPLARDPQILAALQGVVANIPEAPLDMLAVLAIDASDLSVDALIPSLAPALGQRDVRLERLARLATYVQRTPALAALYDELGSALTDRRSHSPAHALARAIGLPEAPVLAFRFLLLSEPTRGGTGGNAGVSAYQGGVRIDSREDPWFAVWLEHVVAGPDRSKDRASRFDHATIAIDDLQIGRCEPAELPAWLATTAKKLRLKWRGFLPITELADDHRKHLISWLLAT